MYLLYSRYIVNLSTYICMYIYNMNIHAAMHRYFSLASAAGKPTNARHAHTSQVQLEPPSYIVGWVTWAVTQNPGYFNFESKGMKN